MSGEDGPRFMGQLNPQGQNMTEIAEKQKDMFIKHFMIDYMEYSMRRVVQENTLHCAKQVGYFRVNEKNMTPKSIRQLDSKFEKCIGKYTDSYEQSLDVFGQHLKMMNKSNIITHSQQLDSKEQR